MSSYAEKNKQTTVRIQTAFLALLEKQPFDAITVGAIAKHAHMNRGTFYLHFVDKFALLEQIEQQLFEDLGNYIDELQARSTSTQTFGQGQEQLASALFGAIKRQAPYLKIFLSDHGRAGFHLRFRAAFSEKVRENLQKNDGFTANLQLPLDYFLAFITSAFLGLIEQWVQNELDKTPEEMTVLYIDMIGFIQRTHTEQLKMNS